MDFAGVCLAYGGQEHLRIKTRTTSDIQNVYRTLSCKYHSFFTQCAGKSFYLRFSRKLSLGRIGDGLRRRWSRGQRRRDAGVIDDALREQLVRAF